MADIHDVTADLDDLNPEDRVFRVGASHVKVKVRHDPTVSRLGHEVLRVTGAHADHKGKAKRRAGGVIEIERSDVVVVADGELSPAALKAAVDAAEHEMVRRTLRAVRNASAIAALGRGVLSAAPAVPAQSAPDRPLALPPPDPSPE